MAVYGRRGAHSVILKKTPEKTGSRLPGCTAPPELRKIARTDQSIMSGTPGPSGVVFVSPLGIVERLHGRSAPGQGFGHGLGDLGCLGKAARVVTRSEYERSLE
jgi:hypothetical protein